MSVQSNPIICTWDDVHRHCRCDVHPLEKVTHLVENQTLFSPQFIASLYSGFPLLSIDVLMKTVKSMADRQFRVFFDTIRQQGVSLDQFTAILQVKKAVALSALGFGDTETVVFNDFLELIESEKSDKTQVTFLLYLLGKMNEDHQALALHFFLKKGVENASTSSLLIADKIAALGVVPNECSFKLVNSLSDTNKEMIMNNYSSLSRWFVKFSEEPSLAHLIETSSDEFWKEMRWL